MPLLKKLRVLAAKIETTSGTAIALGAADAAMNVFDVDIQANIDFNERQQQGSSSMLPGVTGLRGGSLSFKSHLYGDGAAGTPTWASTLLPACGMVESTGTFSPKTAAPGSDVKTLTMGVYENGLFKSLRGSAGTFKVICETGKPISLEWTFTGVWQAPTDVAIIAPTYPSPLPLRFSNSTFTIGGSAPPCMAKIEFDAGNNVVLRECPTVSDGSGYFGGLITERKFAGTMDPEATLVATDDVYGDWIGHTEKALSLSVTDSTDTITIAAPQIQYNNVQEGEREKLQTDDISFMCNASAAAGDDEWTIDFS